LFRVCKPKKKKKNTRGKRSRNWHLFYPTANLQGHRGRGRPKTEGGEIGPWREPGAALRSETYFGRQSIRTLRKNIEGLKGGRSGERWRDRALRGFHSRQNAGQKDRRSVVPLFRGKKEVCQKEQGNLTQLLTRSNTFLPPDFPRKLVAH